MAATMSIVLLMCSFDIVLSTIILLNFKFTERSWLVSTSNFEFCSSSLDLWLLGVIRFTLILGAALGLTKNRRDGVARLKLSRTPIFLISFGIIIYVIVKFLSTTECVLSKSTKIWLWSFHGHSVLFSIGLSCSWWVLGKARGPGTLRHPVVAVNGDQEVGSVLGREPLLSTQKDSDNESNCSSDSSGSSGDSEPKVTKTKVSLKRLLSLSRSDFHYICVAFLFLLMAAVGEMFIPYYTGEVIDSIAIDKDKAKFHKSIVIMAAISFVTAVCSGFRGGIFTLVMGRFYIRVNKLLFGSLVRQEIGFFDKTRTGDIVSRLTSDTGKMGEQVSLNINVFLRNIVTALGVCIVMFRLSWKLTVLSLIGIPVVAVISDVYGKYFQRLSKKVQTSIAKANEVAEEVISAMRTVRSFSNERGAREDYARKLDTTYALKVKEAVAYGGYSWCTQILELAMDAVTLYYGGRLVMRGELSGGRLVSFILYQLSLGSAIEEIGDVYTGLVDAVGAAEKVFEYIDREPEIPNDGRLAPAEFRGSVEFRNVSFVYPSRPDSVVLRDVSFSVGAGEMVAIVGSSGGGKSTCVNLLEHFYEPSSGEVLIDGNSVKDYDHDYLHRKIALVGQEPVLFARTLKENIAYNVPRGSFQDSELDDLVRHAAEVSNAHDFIAELSRGYETQAGEKGQQLSGGQKQRVAIARALIREPAIVLFDEATSALDAESEHKIQEAMQRNLKGRTVIVVAHRLSTIEKADRIIVLSKGELVEMGTHARLVENGGTYAKLVKHQLLTRGEDEDVTNKSPSCQDLRHEVLDPSLSDSASSSSND